MGSIDPAPPVTKNQKEYLLYWYVVDISDPKNAILVLFYNEMAVKANFPKNQEKI